MRQCLRRRSSGTDGVVETESITCRQRTIVMDLNSHRPIHMSEQLIVNESLTDCSDLQPF